LLFAVFRKRSALYCAMHETFCLAISSSLLLLVFAYTRSSQKRGLPSQLFVVNLTSFHNIGHRDTKYVAHVAHHSEYNKTSEDTRATVDKGNN